jgi:hypothetical protein
MNDRSRIIATTMVQILGYLERNPNAADTIDGVAYWVPQSEQIPSRDVLQAALDGLVARRELYSERLPGGALIYRRRGPQETRH